MSITRRPPEAKALPWTLLLGVDLFSSMPRLVHPETQSLLRRPCPLMIRKAAARQYPVETPKVDDCRTVRRFTQSPLGKWTVLIDLCAAASLILMAVQLVICARAKSATFDEQYHITRGLTYLRTGDLRLMREHPPLIEILIALPLAPDDNIVLPFNDPSWELADKHTFSDLVLWETNANGPSIVIRSRIAVILLTLVLGLTIYIWGRKIFGPLPALLSVTMFAFDPNILANGAVATNDVGLSLFATLTMFTFWQLLKKPSATWAVASGLALGLALTSKFSGLFLLPAIIATALADYLTLHRKQGIHLRLRQISIYLCLIAFIAGITLWAVYAFQIGTIRGFSVPAASYFKGLERLANKLENGTQSFLLGSYSDTGWWYYFPIAFMFKTPLPTLLLIGAASLDAVRKKTLIKSMPLWIPIGVYFLLCCVSGLNIGYRHLIPMLPFLFLFAGQLAQASWSHRPKYLAIGAALVWLIAGTLMVSPHYLAYFNELAGGPKRGYRVLVDSNLDWGQDLPGLRDYMTAHNIDSVKLAYCGTADPSAYGINYEPLPGADRFWWRRNKDPEVVVDPGSGLYAISATNLQGARYRNHDVYAWFRAREPEAVIGHSIFIYRVP